MLPPQRAMRPVTPSSVAASISGASTVTRCRSACSPTSASTSGSTSHLDAGSVQTAAVSAARTVSDLARQHRHLHTEQQPPVHPNLLDVFHVHALRGQRGEQPLGDTRAVLAAHRHQVRHR